MAEDEQKTPTLLMIINGVGILEDKENNVIYKAHTPVLDSLMEDYPCVKGLSSGMAVGLPGGQAGNSEVGHINIGAGRIVYQQLTKISKEIQFGTFDNNAALNAAIDFCRQRDSCLHIMGLISDGGVHSHITHLYALLELAKKSGLYKVYVHCFLDGRDTDSSSALFYLERLQSKMREIGVGEIATVMGRFYAMDRSGRYDRIKLAYAAMAYGEGNKASNPEEAVSSAYLRGESDEFVTPTVIVNGGVPVGNINDDDAVIFFNFRADRAKELTKAFCDEEFKLFKREQRPDTFFTCFTEYDPEIENKAVAFPPEFIVNNLVHWLDQYEYKTAAITETEGASYLMNSFMGNVFEPYDNLEATVINSPKVISYDLKPEMASSDITDAVIKAVRSGLYDLIVFNYVNIDICGHMAQEEPLISAIEAVDKNIRRILEVLKETGCSMLICSDHGNAERIMSDNNEKLKSNTNNPVPINLINFNRKYKLRQGGCLADIAPTVLDMMGLYKPAEMTGRSLLVPV
ncbi:MAG: 2,3-bisphosphoglycerate-independent phosphoglycerate mutase [Lachnospiraceae bacterium]|nr:2,3-bisphosphoglycerate-independent phosphoglycerate mutase [Lachnospiraceae bacterium]